MFDMGKLDPNSPLPPKIQIANDLVATIRAGTYRPGDALPSYKALAEEYGVALGTVQSALALLRDQALVVTRHGTGSTVHPDLDPDSLPAAVPGASLSVQSADIAEVLRILNEISGRLDSIERRLVES